MTSPAEMPSMFGRFTAIIQDHAHLGTTLKQLRSMCAALEAEVPLPTPASPQRLLEDLRADLSAHFAAEEAEAYFGTIAEEAPALATRIDQLIGEHATMLGVLVELCRAATDAERLLELAHSTRRLIGQLEQHERAESLLLRELFALGGRVS